ncbi:hypothetical protein THAOC_02626 [Thalassiosira oceanica]|uniref:AB hydrolase-1 domain-containing protein n=1 Tax=Thalassiosira oceanica TaxID=159749 RepID=K0TEY2_THAOC|nr:hypothetical protein THAOC_02626 [Thalassiosira oceanica]|eukprot:EJK75644.1 hypothetical protein THAOC_02626 [Thalassiosira oceanica]
MSVSLTESYRAFEILDIVYLSPSPKDFCVTFAVQQPAPKGNLAIHCGGPGSLSSCLYNAEIMLPDELRGSYNIVAVDQRGMGRSEPTFMVEDCAVQLQDEDGALSAMSLINEDSVRAASKVYKQRALRCWNHPGFRLEAEQADGSSRTFHFLEYSGTRQLAEDLERFRVLFGSQKLNIYGISYGTVVMGTYATVFPNNVNLMILDANVDPGSDIVSRTVDDARAKQQRLDYFIASCEFGNGQCGGDRDMRTCVNNVNEMVDAVSEQFDSFLTPFASLFELFGIRIGKSMIMAIVLELLFSVYEEVEFVCDIAADGAVESFWTWLMDKFTIENSNPMVSLIAATNTTNITDLYPMDSESKPTSGFATPDFPFKDYTIFAEVTSVCQDMITAQDMSLGAYDEDRYVKFLMELHQQYPGAGTQMPVGHSIQWYSSTYYWPNSTPLAPMGNPFVKGIIAGQLHDPWTPYQWTQDMRNNFKSATLLTSRSVNHGINAAIGSLSSDSACYDNILRYLETGVVDFTDGKACESAEIGDSCTISEILSNGQCPPHVEPQNNLIANK